MKKTLFLLFAVSFIFINIAGCSPLLIGAAVGGAGVYAISKDTVQGETDKPYDSLWNEAVNVSKVRGTIKQEDYARGTIELEADSSKVWIRVIRLTRLTNRLRVCSRKYHLPNLGLAQEVFTKIMGGAR